jgi:hypothetical protein
MAQRAFFRILGIAGGVGILAGCAAQSQSSTDNFIVPLSNQRLVGATPQTLKQDFGQPILQRVDGSAQVWLYRSPVCGLSLFLYPDANGVPRVAAAIPDNGAVSASCMASLEQGVTNVALESPASS